jgi:L-lactate dehydrogenase complex protein LldE
VTVALFVPCFVDQFYPRAGIATLEVLERLGYTVALPEGAACCGQPVANAGMERAGLDAARRFVRTYAPYDHVVMPSGSCALHVRHHYEALERAGEGGAALDRVRTGTREVCEFLHDVAGLDAVAALRPAFAGRVALHTGCHGLRGLGLARPTEIQAAPFDKVRALLGLVDGLTVTDLARPDECCGFGGTFAVAEPELSSKIGRDRLADLLGERRGDAPPDAVVTTDSSCGMHLQGLARRAGAGVPFLHVTEVLAGAPAPR